MGEVDAGGVDLGGALQHWRFGLFRENDVIYYDVVVF